MTVLTLIAIYLTPSVLVLLAGTGLAVWRTGRERRISSDTATLVDAGPNSPTAGA